MSTKNTYKISPGSLEALKWLGLLTMTIDHINRFFWNGSIYPMYCIGRMAFPLFTFVFTYHFAHQLAVSTDFYKKMAWRCLLFGTLATPAYWAMFKFQLLLPLNVLFTFLILLICFYCLEKQPEKKYNVIAVFFLGGFVVDYAWFGLAFGIACWFFCKAPHKLSNILGLVGTLIALYMINQNAWGIMALPFILLASIVDMPIMRVRHLFWYYYPIHLWGLFLMSSL